MWISLVLEWAECFRLWLVTELWSEVISDIYSDDMLVKQQGNYVCGDGGNFSVLDKINKAIIGT